MNLKFTRQYPIRFEYEEDRRFFIADFYCHEKRLVIEIDGGIHETQKDYDDLRTAIINALGMQVIRFRNRDVLNDMEAVLEKLKKIMCVNSPHSLREVPRDWSGRGFRGS